MKRKCVEIHPLLTGLDLITVAVDKGHRQSDEHWNCFKGNAGETSDSRCGAHNYGLLRAHGYHLELN